MVFAIVSALFGAVVDAVRPRASLVAEILVLRQQGARVPPESSAPSSLTPPESSEPTPEPLRDEPEPPLDEDEVLPSVGSLAFELEHAARAPTTAASPQIPYDCLLKAMSLLPL